MAWVYTNSRPRRAQRAPRLEQHVAHPGLVEVLEHVQRVGAREGCPCGRAAGAGRRARGRPSRAARGRKKGATSMPAGARAARRRRRAPSCPRRSRGRAPVSPGGGASMRRIMSALTRAESTGGASVTPSRSWNSWSAYWVTSPTGRAGHEVDVAARPAHAGSARRSRGSAARRPRSSRRTLSGPPQRAAHARRVVGAQSRVPARGAAQARAAAGLQAHRAGHARAARRRSPAPPAPAARGR